MARMTKKQLVEALDNYEDDDEVYFAYNSGDYWNTIVVKAVSVTENTEIKWSAYHDQYQIDETGEGYEDSDYPNKRVVVLS